MVLSTCKPLFLLLLQLLSNWKLLVKDILDALIPCHSIFNNNDSDDGMEYTHSLLQSQCRLSVTLAIVYVAMPQ